MKIAIFIAKKRLLPGLLQEPEYQHPTVLRYTYPRQTRQWIQNILVITTLVEWSKGEFGGYSQFHKKRSEFAKSLM